VTWCKLGNVALTPTPDGGACATTRATCDYVQGALGGRRMAFKRAHLSIAVIAKGERLTSLACAEAYESGSIMRGLSGLSREARDEVIGHSAVFAGAEPEPRRPSSYPYWGNGVLWLPELLPIPLCGCCEPGRLRLVTAPRPKKQRVRWAVRRVDGAWLSVVVGREQWVVPSVIAHWWTASSPPGMELRPNEEWACRIDHGEYGERRGVPVSTGDVLAEVMRALGLWPARLLSVGPLVTRGRPTRREPRSGEGS
jgi:hypothetical protein